MDDGTAVIDCAHRQAPAKKPQANDESHPLHIAKPIAYVGHSVCIMGKVKSQYRTRQILVDQLGEMLLNFLHSLQLLTAKQM